MRSHPVTSNKPPELPKPPQIRRRIRLHRYQAVGMALLFLFPLAGLTGLLQSRMTVASDNGEVSLRVEYPRILRDSTATPMRIAAANRRTSSIEKMEIRLSRDYLAAFDQYQINPNPDEIDGKDLVFVFEHVKPGESREIALDFQCVLPGIDRGGASVTAEGRPTGRVSFSTLVLP